MIYAVYLWQRDLVYNGWWHGLSSLHNQTQNKEVTVSDINILHSNKVNKRLECSSEVRCWLCGLGGGGLSLPLRTGGGGGIVLWSQRQGRDII